MEEEKDNIIRLTLRMPVTLRDQLEKRIRKNRRSLNAEVVILLERFVDSKEISVPNTEKTNIQNQKGEEEIIQES